MPTQRKPVSFAFQGCQGRKVAASFNGGAITSNAGALLLGRIGRNGGLFDRVAACFTDHRDPRLTEHSVRTLVAQRIVGLALGYEDLNDHDHLRRDPVLGLLAGKLGGGRGNCAALAGKSTLNRLEHAPKGEPGRYHRIGHEPAALQNLLAELFVNGWTGPPPARLVLDIDCTDDETHGRQEGRAFHGYYGHHCLLPLHIFCGAHPLAAILRPGNADPAGGVAGALERIVSRLRRRWPNVQLLVRADSAYAREEIMAFCEARNIHYVIGLARNDRLVEKIAPELLAAKVESRGRRRPARHRPARLYAEFPHATRTSWSRFRRVIAKAEHIPGKRNPRFVVTSLPLTIPPRTVYERVYGLTPF
ncbi:IS1380 family transposase [Candidatus Palauibacter sp.]|uniref:IS1380 family transposase n=1 Tax=Candidatus Palauibacter sp. TaxID=3101350 RepID=UPI003B599B1F